MKISKIKIIKKLNGLIYKIHSEKKNSTKIKELYFNQISAKQETLWIRHKIAICNFYVVKGFCMIKTIGKNNKKKNINVRDFTDTKITIKAGDWFKIVNRSNKNLILLNYLDIKHKKNEFEKRKNI